MQRLNVIDSFAKGNKNSGFIWMTSMTSARKAASIFFLIIEKKI
jgi:hypothetical protein